MLNTKYFQGHVLCMSVTLLSVMVFLGTSLEVKEKRKKYGSANPEEKKEIPLEEPLAQAPETSETVEPEPESEEIMEEQPGQEAETEVNP